jgi:hypothetical protein
MDDSLVDCSAYESRRRDGLVDGLRHSSHASQRYAPPPSQPRSVCVCFDSVQLNATKNEELSSVAVLISSCTAYRGRLPVGDSGKLQVGMSLS